MKKLTNKTKIIITISIIVLLFTIILIFFNYFNKSLNIKLNGKEKVIVSVNNKYKEYGASAKFLNKNISKDIIIKGKVNTKKIGTYKITYTIKKLLLKKSISRKVLVKDLEKPVITLENAKEIYLVVGNIYKEYGYTALDNYDKDITSKVKVIGNIDTNVVGSYTLTYTVKDKSNNEDSVERIIKVYEEDKKIEKVVNSNNGITYIKGILLVNKKYSLPSDYNPGVNNTAKNAFNTLQEDAKKAGFNIPILSSFRSYNYQTNLYNRYVSRDGESVADTYSAKPGHSEHQTGLAFDVGEISDDYGNTPSGIWLKNNCIKYGFILRYPQGKESITGYKYEPWHIRYIGSASIDIMSQGLTLEEYLGVN